ncbi:MAG: molybdopterin oxidoreductase [Gammaproteobacteria bacterium]|jgi:anaerobic selenocysteine-containing dehydrogenase|nr:molybdopterin oxidoreductase [Gammaproteobacteria bacterium]
MTNQNFKPTACNICYANCGVIVQLDETGRQIVKVRGDKSHPVSRGYICNKAARLNYYQNGRDRLASPLRRKDDGSFEPVDWDTAIKEIADEFSRIRESYGGDKIMYYGGGGQGNHLGGSYSGSVQKALGMKYRSNAIAQEKTGKAWTSNRVLGGGWHGDFEVCDVAIIVGKNPWQSNGIQRARVVIRNISKDPDRTLIVMDPRVSETAELADIHLAVKPGSDVWCITAILGYMVQNGLANLDWLQVHTTGYERVLEQLASADVEGYAAFAGIDIVQIIQVATLLGGTNRIGVYEDLGVEMAPYSTLCTYLNILLFLIPGGYGNEGGMHLTTGLVSAAASGGARPADIDEEGYEYGYRVTPVTGARIINGLMPCNSIPEEILSDHPDRFRAMLIESANPIHSLADSQKFRKAFEALEFLVVIDVAMTETAMVADYVLPASSQYEKYEATFFPTEFPENFFHLRKPLMAPKQGTLEEAEMHARLVEALKVFEPGELTPLAEAARQGLDAFAEAMLPAMEDRKIRTYLPYVLYRTLGPTLADGAASAASLWGLCLLLSMSYPNAVRAAGHEGSSSLTLGNSLFQAILDNPSGVIILKQAAGDASQWRKPDGKLHLLMGEMSDEIDYLAKYRLPTRTDKFPLILSAGERRLYTANTLIRDPEWMKSNNPTSLFVHPDDASGLGIEESARANLVTKRGRAEVVVELDHRLQRGTVALPNGLGLLYPDKDGLNEIFGVAPNDLTDIDDRDPWVGTPWHKFVRARLEAIR